MLLTTFPWQQWVELSGDVTTHPPVPHAKGFIVQVILLGSVCRKHFTLFMLKGIMTVERRSQTLSGGISGRSKDKRHRWLEADL